MLSRMENEIAATEQSAGVQLTEFKTGNIYETDDVNGHVTATTDTNQSAFSNLGFTSDVTDQPTKPNATLSNTARDHNANSYDNRAFRRSTNDVTAADAVYQSRDKNKPPTTSQRDGHCSRSRRCLIVIAACCVLLVVAIGVGLGLGLGLGLKGHSEKTQVPVSLVCVLRLNSTWYSDLADPSSVTYQSLRTQLTAALAQVLVSAGYNGQFNISDNVLFQPGSIIAVLNLVITSTNVSPTSVTQVLRNGFKHLMDTQQVSFWIIDPDDTGITVLELSSSSTTPTSSPLSTTTTQRHATCFHMPTNECSTLGYNKSGFPNIFGHSNVQSADGDLSALLTTLLPRQCYNQTVLFACASSYPKCDSLGWLIYPCRDFCLDVRHRCNYPLVCELFPDDNDPAVCVLTPTQYRPVYVPPAPPFVNCSVGEYFRCGNDRCVSWSLFCNGFDDCGDFSDELNCTAPSILDCTFETAALCGYTSDHSSSGYTWTVVQGFTDTFGTRPFYDHSTHLSTGHYAVAAATGARYQDVTSLTSASLYFTQKYCLRFYYYMNGTDVDSLSVYVGTSLVWVRRKEQGARWRYGYVQLYSITDSHGSYIVNFRAVRGQGYRSDVALDDISARPGLCPVQVCDSDQFACSNGISCILKSFVCNRVNDCDDFSDETNCTCSSTEFRCDSGVCIAGYLRCDSKIDCSDGSDELDCVCPLGQYLCANGTCIMAEWLCDKQKDCPEGDDELNCGVCNETSFQCTDYSCVSRKLRCNGIGDCKDASDEMNCVRLKAGSFIVEAYNSSGVWFPLCNSGLPDFAAQQICQDLGMGSMLTRDTAIVASNYYFAYHVGSSGQRLMANFSLSASCSQSAVLTLQCQAAICGRPTLDTSITPYIVHGSDSPAGRWPWQVAIFVDADFLCGGSLVDNIHVITAAHCFPADTPLSSYVIFLGSNLRTGGQDSHRVKRNVKLATNHPQYQYYYWGYDISVLTLSEAVNFTDYILPVCLTAPTDQLSTSMICYSTGWGLTDYKRNDSLPIVLQQGKMKLWTLQQCQAAYSYATSLIQCAGYMSGYIANCPGDSGGPLVCWTESSYWSLVGVFSFLSSGCNVPMKPSGFTSVQRLHEWITDELVCKFTCTNGKCIWDLNDLCNGVNDCGDNSDEFRPCNASISCSFEDNYLCGYTIISTPGQLTSWSRVTGKAGNNEGPTVDTTRGDPTGHYLYARGGLSTLIAPIYNATSDHCLQYRRLMRSATAGRLVVFTQAVTGSDVSALPPPAQIPLTNVYIERQIDGHQGDIWYTDRIDLPAGVYLIGFNASATISAPSAAVAIDDVKLLAGSCSSQQCNSDQFTCVDGSSYHIYCVPSSHQCNFFTDCIDISDELDCPDMNEYWCDFDRFIDCGLEQSVDDSRDWSIQSTMTSVDNNRPAGDHTNNSTEGYYGYYNTLNANTGQNAKISLPVYLVADGCFSFYYSMISNGRLTVFYSDGSNSDAMWTVISQNVSGWQSVQLSLPSTISLIILDAVSGIEPNTASVSYVAIDDVSIVNSSCAKRDCFVTEFRCDDGQCIDQELVCDGLNATGCSDGSDESNRTCVCNSDSFQCHSGQCLQSHVRCDGVSNCADGSDEENCDSCNSTTGYKCVSDGICKPLITWCDGVQDCHDGSDELANCTCLSVQFTCSDSYCIPLADYCNELFDCPDGSDEPADCRRLATSFVYTSHAEPQNNAVQIHNETIALSSKSNDCIQCRSGPCIDRLQVCDGMFDCPDFSDERNCQCTHSDAFNCSNGLCATECNAINECGDGSDETGCEPCQSDQFQCNNGRCIYNSFVCDFTDDCDDNSDETNCHYTSCRPGQYRCPSGRCLQSDWVCDGQPDCDNGEDEHGCSNCSAEQFTCTDYECVQRSRRCNGVSDCRDSSDEDDCVMATLIDGTSQSYLSAYYKESYYPICAANWTRQHSRDYCELIDAGQPVVTSTLTYNSPVYLSPTNSIAVDVTSFRSIASCPNASAVRVVCSDPACGISMVTTAILVGGDLAATDSWPWVASILFDGQYRCTSSYIGTGWIITAAHCFSNGGESLVNMTERFAVRVGSTRSRGYDPQLTVYSVKRIVVYSGFAVKDNGEQVNDIAMLQLGDVILGPKVVATTHHFPICLPESDVDEDALRFMQCYVVGWGVTNPNEDAAVVDLRQSKMRVWTYAECSQIQYWGHGLHRYSSICAGYHNDYVTVCNGDSGGPLMCRDHKSGAWTLRGTVSYGISPCVGSAMAVKPTVFTNVYYFTNWIKSVVLLFS